MTGHGDRGRAAQWVMALVAQPSLGPRGEYLDDADRNGAPRSQAYLLEAAALHLALLSVPGVGTVKAALLLKERRGIWKVATADDEVGAGVRRHAAAARAAVGRALTSSIAVVPFE
ncbi:MAG TPA: hypothetical protein VKZ43_00955, partial [Trueperaceae bacterium]|nr:hypothetical protein [Trueperaceae bacterium]